MIRRWALDLLALGATLAFLTWLFPWQLILSPTAPTGGDTPSHYAALIHFMRHILPQCRFWGWDPGGLGGLPLFQLYFPLPFVCMAALGQVLHPAVAFKLLALAPALALPVSVFLCLRQLRVAFPGPAAGAVFSLSFLLMETNKLWGGNLLSILTGMFCYAWGLNLSLLFLGLLPSWLEGRRGPLLPAVLLALVGYSHIYVLLFTLAAGGYFILEPGGFGRSVPRLALVYLLGLLLLAPWLAPTLIYAPLYSMVNPIWHIKSWRNYLPPGLLPLLAAGGLTILLVPLSGPGPHRRAVAYLLHWLFCSAALFLAAPHLGGITIRFGAFGHLALVLLAAVGAALLGRKLAAVKVWALLLITAGMFWAGMRPELLPTWLAWNNAGSEARPAWPIYQRLAHRLKGDYADPRVVYEHSMGHRRFGSVRAFEVLPLWSGRATLEGLYNQSSINSPFIFYLQSELSPKPVYVLTQYVYSFFNLARGVEHLRLYNTSHLIAASPKVKRAADKLAALSRVGDFGHLTLYRLEGSPLAYASPPGYRPLLVVTQRPRRLAYDWFRFTDLATPLVFASRLSPGAKRRFARVFHDSGRQDDPLLMLIRHNRLPRLPLIANRPREKVAPERIELSNLTPGKPVLVRISYHPAWRSLQGESVYWATPAFLLVFPRAQRLTLVFGWAWPHRLGLALFLFGLLLMAAMVLWPAPINRLPALEEQPAPFGGRRLLLLAAAGFSLLALLVSLHYDEGTLRRRALELRDSGHPGQAAALLKRIIERWPHYREAPLALFDLAMIAKAQKNDQAAAAHLRRLLHTWPDSPLLPQTLYNLDVILGRLGREEQARGFRRQLLQRFPDHRLAGIARRRK